MNYKVLYRKYRPQTFEDVVGQDYIVKTLKNSIINNKVSHAYIFSGPRGTGKTSTAKIFSKAVNCLTPNDASPCGKCEFCLNFNNNPDIIEIDAASNNGVDEIRNLIDNIKLVPTNGKYKVYIIDEVHMLTTSAFNALLLTLEEPPSHAIFILATTNVENVPITIQSRCQRFDFRKISVDDIYEYLKTVCQKEKIKITDDALNEIAYLSDGGMRDSLSLLDQLSKNNDKITLEMIESEVKTISRKSVDDLVKSFLNNDLEKFLELLNDLRERNVDYKSLVKRIVEILSSEMKNNIVNKSGLSPKICKNLIIEISGTLVRTNIYVDSYIILESIFLQYFDELFKKEKDNKNKVEFIKEDVSDNKSEVGNIEVKINNCFFGAQKQDLEYLKNEINKLVETNTIKGKIKSIIIDSTLAAASDKYCIFYTESKDLANNANSKIYEIEDELNKHLDRKIKMIFIDKDRWNIEKNKYINNKKAGYKYTFIEENENDNKEFVNDVFNKEKVEII